VLRETVGEFTPTSLAYFAVAAAQSDRRRELAPEIARRLVAPANSRHAAAVAALVGTWLGDGSNMRLDIPERWARDLASLLSVPERDLIPLDPIREDALLGSLALELVAGFDSKDEEWANARADHERASNLFGLVATRFRRLLPEKVKLQEDMVYAVEKLCRVLGYDFIGRDPRARELVSLVSAGYVWRLAEGPRGSVAKQWMSNTVSRTFDRDEPRSSSLGRAATQCLAQPVPLGLASPGGLSHGRAIFDASFANAMRAFGSPAVVVSDEDRFYGYTFGVALCDVEPMVDALRATDAS